MSLQTSHDSIATNIDIGLISVSEIRGVEQYRDLVISVKKKKREYRTLLNKTLKSIDQLQLSITLSYILTTQPSSVQFSSVYLINQIKYK